MDPFLVEGVSGESYYNRLLLKFLYLMQTV